MASKHTGRRPILDQALIEAICEYIESGNYIKIAAQACGVSETLYHNWRKAGENEEARLKALDAGAEDVPEKGPNADLYLDFLVSVRAARAKAEADAAQRIANIARNAHDEIDPRVSLEADKFLLERSYKDRWGRNKVEADVTVTGDVKLVLDLPKPGRLDDE